MREGEREREWRIWDKWRGNQETAHMIASISIFPSFPEVRPRLAGVELLSRESILCKQFQSCMRRHDFHFDRARLLVISNRPCLEVVTYEKAGTIKSRKRREDLLISCFVLRAFGGGKKVWNRQRGRFCVYKLELIFIFISVHNLADVNLKNRWIGRPKSCFIMIEVSQLSPV